MLSLHHGLTMIVIATKEPLNWNDVSHEMSQYWSFPINSIPKIPLLTLVPTLWHLFCAWQMDKIFSKLSFPAGYLVSGTGTWTIAYSNYLHSTKMLCCGTIFRIIIALSWDWNGIAQITIYYCATFLIECYLLLNILFLIYLLSKLALGKF